MTTRIPLLIALIACGSDGAKDPADSGPATGSPTSAGLVASAAPAPETAAVWLVSWTTTEPASGWVEFGPTEDLGRTTATSEPTTAHEHALIGLKAGQPVFWRAHALISGVEQVSELQQFDAPPPPPGLLVPTLTASRPGSLLAGGYLLSSQIQPMGDSWLWMLDGEGDLVWYRKAAPGAMIVTSRPARNGTDLFVAEWDLAQQDDVGWLYRIGLDGRSALATQLDKGHHDFYEWPDGTIGFYGFEADPAQWIASDSVMEVAEGADATTPTTRIWSWLEDYPVAPWLVCDHMAAGWPRDPRFEEWTHSNSLMVDPDGQHYYVMSKFQDTLLKIRRSDGALIWQLNGQYGDFWMAGGGPAWSGTGQTALWSHGHASHLYAAPPGSGYDLCLAVFDNGMHYTPEASRAIEVCLDEASMTAELTWSYDEPYGGFTPLMGDVRRLDSGWLVGWSGIGHIDEVSDAGEVLWSVALPPGVSAGRVSFLPSL